MDDKRPKVGVGVAIMRDGKVLLGERRGAYAPGTWSLPGGHLEFGESWEECARRETLEETGLVLKDVHVASVTNDIYEMEDVHYVTIVLVAQIMHGEASIMEPEKCTQWQWFAPNKLPEPLFVPTANAIEELKRKKLL